MVGIATATAVHTPALPPPILRIRRNIEVLDSEDVALMQLQTRIESLAARNRERMLEASKDDAIAYRNAVSAMKEVINYEIERVNRRQRNRGGSASAFAGSVEDAER